jgi:transposase
VQSQQLPTESQVLEDEVLPGTENAEQPAEEMSERYDHGKNFSGKIRIQLFAKSFILQVYDVLARHTGSVGTCDREQIWGSPSVEPHGINFSAPRCGTVAKNHVRLDGRLCELVSPVWERMKEIVLTSKAVQTDDTPVPVRDRNLTRTRTGRIWTYVGDRNGPYIVYDYTGNRSREGPEEFLRGYSGFLQADAYAAYDAMFTNPRRSLTEIACWAHSRRYFFEAQTSDLCRATVMLAYIQLLYEVEREARNATAEQRGELRQAKSRPILQDIKNYLQTEKPKVLPKSPMSVAIDYTLSNWEALLRYTEDGDLEIDNNRAERSLRSIVVGRRNWLFYGSDKGGRTGAVLSTLIASCKRLGIEPFAYLRDLFTRISTHPNHRHDELLPDKWLVVQQNVSSVHGET